MSFCVGRSIGTPLQTWRGGMWFSTKARSRSKDHFHGTGAHARDFRHFLAARELRNSYERTHLSRRRKKRDDSLKVSVRTYRSAEITGAFVDDSQVGETNVGVVSST